MDRMWIWVFVDNNISSLPNNSRDMLGGRIFWDHEVDSGSSCIGEGASLL
jgi:hypothetical protein